MREFDPIKHEYSNDGKKYIGVNALLIAEGLKPDLRKFVDPEALQLGGSKGKTVHKIAEYTLKGTLNPETVDTALQPFKEQIDCFIADYDVSPLHIETLLWDDIQMFAGTPDLIAKTNKGLAIVDWCISGEKYLQMLCYKLLAKKYLNLDIDILISVLLKDNKPYCAKEYKPERKNELVIISALILHNYKRRKNG